MWEKAMTSKEANGGRWLGVATEEELDEQGAGEEEEGKKGVERHMQQIVKMKLRANF